MSRALRGSSKPTPALTEPEQPAQATDRGRSGGSRWIPWVLGAVLWAAGLVLAVAPLAASRGTHLWDPWLARLGAGGATWFAVMLIARRIGGPLWLVAGFTGGCIVAVEAFPRGWVLSGAAVAAATSYGLLGMVMTRPAAGLRTLREATVAMVFGLAGAIAVTGYDVGVRPYRFRMVVLALTLAAALALAWRLGKGFRSLGRRGTACIVGAVVLLVVTVAYVQAIRHWGPEQVLGALTGTNGTIRDLLGASPRPIEALVGFPAVVWGVAVRNWRRQGWWMSAFGSLAAAGVATSLAQRSVALREVAESTGYGFVIGCALGLFLVGLDRLLTGLDRRTRVPGGSETERPEPARAASLV